MLALEEPELHLAPGLQGRLVAEAISIADQTVCTTHAPSVAMMYPPTSAMIMSASGGTLSAVPMLEKALAATSTNDERKLYYQGRSRFLSALMHPYILVPEGRFDWEWLERLAGRAEPAQKATPFSTVFGVAPTENGGVKRMAEIAKRLRPLVIPLTDGDGAGDGYEITLSRERFIFPPSFVDSGHAFNPFAGQVSQLTRDRRRAAAMPLVSKEELAALPKPGAT